MRFENFKKLPDHEKIDSLKDNGRELGQRIQDNHRITLFEIYGYYVQVARLLNNDKVVSIDVFDEMSSGIKKPPKK
jgi:hypothetical protein